MVAHYGRVFCMWKSLPDEELKLGSECFLSRSTRHLEMKGMNTFERNLKKTVAPCPDRCSMIKNLPPHCPERTSNVRSPASLSVNGGFSI